MDLSVEKSIYIHCDLLKLFQVYLFFIAFFNMPISSSAFFCSLAFAANVGETTAPKGGIIKC